MHYIYHTEGIILGSKNYKEADKYFYIFTRDLGLIYASAQGIRKMSSKLRFVLQDFSYVKVDLVSGRDIFRITSASANNLLNEIKNKKENFKIFVNITRLLRRLLAGVEPNEILFQDVVNGLFVLENANVPDLPNVEMIIVLRILNNLGYIGKVEDWENLIKSPFEDGLIFEASRSRSKVLKYINKALKETHL